MTLVRSTTASGCQSLIPWLFGGIPGPYLCGSGRTQGEKEPRTVQTCSFGVVNNYVLKPISFGRGPTLMRGVGNCTPRTAPAGVAGRLPVSPCAPASDSIPTQGRLEHSLGGPVVF